MLRRSGHVIGLALLAAMFLFVPAGALAQSNDPTLGLDPSNAFITPRHLPHSRIRPGDIKRLLAVTARAGSQGVPEKLAIVSALPADLTSADVGAQRLFTLLDYSGVIVVVAPGKLGIASDLLSAAHIHEIERKTRPLCRTAGYTACIVKAGELAIPLAKDDYSNTKRNAYIFWIVLLGGTGGLVAAAALTLNVRRKRLAANLHDLNASALLAIDRAEARVREQALAGAGASTDTPEDLQRAHELVLSAHHAAENPRSRIALREANERAAEAITIVDSTRTVPDMGTAAARPRCLYCGRDDRPPYVTRSIEDGHDRALDAQICVDCMALLEQGKTPRIATVEDRGLVVPWFAVEGDPWYVVYGGASWQYWLPFITGRDVATWFDGGWR